MAMVVFLLVSVLVTKCFGFTDPVDYDEQTSWGGDCNKGGAAAKQSPVDVITPNTCAHLYENSVIALQEGAKSVKLTNRNNVHTLKFNVGDQDMKYSIPGKENTQATILQIHLHWGRYETEGSEHQIDGVQHAAEAHLVTSYGSDGKYAVLGRLFEVGKKNAEIQKMIDATKATKDSAERNVADFNLESMYSEVKTVITYDGSLTTPDCNEIVYWVVVPELLTISIDQLTELRDLALGDDPSTGTALSVNWRRLQNLNGREFTCYSAAFSSFVTFPLLVATALAILLL